MSQKELRRVGVLSRVAAASLKLVEASELLRVSYRQAKRLWRRFRGQGGEGLKHGNAGRRSNRAKAGKFRRWVLGLVRKHYGGEPGERFGPTLAAEQLEKDHGVKMDALRRWMLAEGLWSRERKRKPYRKRRERRAHFGELVQMDGSLAAWLEARGPRGCLMDLVDDATRVTLAQMGEEETTWAAADCLRAWGSSTGYRQPCTQTGSWKNVYLREATPKEQLRGETPLTQFGRMCAKLGIRIIGASSPQAKGRCERQHGVHQDRLIKLLRLQGASSLEQVNQYLEQEYWYLEQEYWREHNRRFAKAPAQPADFHRPVEPGLDLRPVFCLEEERVVSQD